MLTRMTAALAAGVSVVVLAGVSSAATVLLFDDVNDKHGVSGDEWVAWAGGITGSTGSGVLDAFLREPADKEGYHAGYNDVSLPGNAQLLVSDLVTTGDGNYYEFLFDVNETKNTPAERLISLHNLKIYVGPAGAPAEGITNWGLYTKVFELDAPRQGPAIDYRLDVDYELGTGSGKGDLRFFVRKDLFGSPDPTKNVYVFAEIGNAALDPADYSGHDGYEEWGYREDYKGDIPGPAPVVPLPAAVWGGLGLLGAFGAVRWARIH